MIPDSDIEATARRLFALQALLAAPELARFYTDFLINTPTTIPHARERQGISKSTAYKYANKLAELDVAEELNQREDGANLWGAEAIVGTWTAGTSIEITPTMIAVFGATSIDETLELFVEKHGKAALVPAISGTIEYLDGNTTRRGIAESLGIPAVEGIAISQTVEQIIGVVKNHDPALEEMAFELKNCQRVSEQAPYQRPNE